VTRLPIPILLYHAVTRDPPSWLAPWTINPHQFAGHLDALVAADCTPLTVSDLVRITTQGEVLPERPVVVTFDDGFADFATEAVPAMAARSVVSTLYVTTGALIGNGGSRGATSRTLKLPPAPMLSWQQLAGLEELGVEIGAHSHTHPQLDTLPVVAAAEEIVHSRALLEEHMGHHVESFAYPHGYSSPAVRRVVAQQGFSSAAGVRNRFSAADDDQFCLARLTVRSETSVATIRSWLSGSGAPTASPGESLSTRLWRGARRARTAIGANHPS